MNPCRECNVYIKTGKNHGPECGDCNKRAEYVAGLGDMTHSVPDHLTALGGDGKGAFMAEQPKTNICDDFNKDEQILKTCKKCGVEGSVAELFSRNRKSSDGYMHICKICMGKRISDSHKKKEAVFQKRMREQDKTLIIDFESFPEILDDLKTLADQEIRSPENMALYLFKRIHDAGPMQKLIEMQ